MKKILYGFIGLFLVIGIVAGTAYAIFTTSANVTGVVLGTATPGLHLCDSQLGNPSGCAASYTFPTNNPFGPLVPGGEDYAEFFLKNISSEGLIAGGNVLNLDLSAKITYAEGNWDELKDAILMRICVHTTLPNVSHCDVTQATEWKSLAQWNSTGFALLGGPLGQGVTKGYTVMYRLPSYFDNAVAGYQIENMTIVFTGTQAL